MDGMDVLFSEPQSTPAQDKKGAKRDSDYISPLSEAEQKKTCRKPLAKNTSGVPETKIELNDMQILKIADVLRDTFESQLSSMVSTIVSKVTEGMQAELSSLRAENNELRDRVSQLEGRVHDLELAEDDAAQYSRRNCLCVSGIEETENEDTDAVVTKLFKQIDVDINIDEIDRCHRLGKKRGQVDTKRRPREIIIKFATYRARQKFYKKRTSLRSSRATSGVYVNKHLTRKRSELYYNARQLVKNNRVRRTWTSDGSIFLEDLRGKVHRCESLDYLDQFK